MRGGVTEGRGPGKGGRHGAYTGRVSAATAAKSRFAAPVYYVFDNRKR